MKIILRQLRILLPLFALLVLLPQNLIGGEPPADEKNNVTASVEERRILLDLQQEKDKLTAQQKLLNAREMELKTLQSEVDKKLSELRRMREEVEKLVAQKEEEENARILDLSKVYEKMDPAKAATVLASLKTELAVDILANMKQKSAGKILNNMDGEKAATLSVAFAKLQQQ